MRHPGAIDAPKYKDYILPLIFLKRLSDVFEDELAGLGPVAKHVDEDHKLVAGLRMGPRTISTSSS